MHFMVYPSHLSSNMGSCRCMASCTGSVEDTWPMVMETHMVLLLQIPEHPYYTIYISSSDILMKIYLVTQVS